MSTKQKYLGVDLSNGGHHTRAIYVYHQSEYDYWITAP